MRVAYVLKQYPRFSETFVVNEILAHEAAGLSLDIYSLRPALEGRFQDGIARVRAAVTYLPADGKMTDFWQAYQQASDVLPGFDSGLDAARGAEARDVHQALLLALDARRRGIDHLHAHFASAATTVARLAARFAALPYSLTAHAKDIYHHSVTADQLGQKLRDAAAVVTVSDYNVEFLRDTYGGDAADVTRIYNGLDLSRFTYCDPVDRPARVVSIGRLVEKKGFFDLIDACGLLAERRPPFVCQIIGDGELDQPLRKRIEQLGLASVVQMLGPLPQSKVIPHIQQAAVLAAPCMIGNDGNRDGLPTVLLEAMALGTPCISTDVTGIPELVRHGQTGLLVPQHDPQQLAEALTRLLDDAPLRTRLARAARRLIETDFNIEVNAARQRALFHSSRPVAPVSIVAAATTSQTLEEVLPCA